MRRFSEPAAAVVQFAVTGTLAVLLLGFLAVTLLRNTGRSEAIRDARQTTRLAGEGVVAPNITPALERGDPRAIAAMDRVVKRAVLRDPVVRVKIWNPRGRIIYSDRHELIGSGYQLHEDELRSLRNGTDAAEVSDLSRPENRFERPEKKLLEVYLGIRSRTGHPLLYEGYQRYSSISASSERIWKRFLPGLIGALVLLELAQIPLAWSLARRLQRGQRERVALLQRAIDASDHERSRIARDLHDGVVQNLAGVSYGLAAAAEELPPESPARARVDEGAEQTRRSVRELRTLLVDIYPPALQRAGLQAALADLLTGVGGQGCEVQLTVEPEELRLAPATEALLFRAAQEAVRNVRKHADAQRLDVSVVQTDGSVVLEVVDDGRGFEPSANGDGHFGLRILADLARDAGASFRVESAPGEGTRVRLEAEAT
ncbi:MAG: two-component system, NarL family, sensor kinase [Thermoleophilaceae bacterium]|jgi:signal transduction histidine kinase|nr:two-component system, NarL family, sensor kinase [Thermoleophilaceae bacterium]